jgi:hypothetical protein
MSAPIVYADSVKPEIGKGFGLLYSDEGARELAKLGEQPGGVEKLIELKKLQEADPISYGWLFPAWANVLACWCISQIFVILGGNRSGKSTLCARLVIWAALNIPGARIRCWSANEETSINDQQKAVWNELPLRYKNLPKKRFAQYSIDYTQKNGFTGGKLILPPLEPGYDGGEIIFQTYKSWSNDDKVAEGWWAHLVWADEEIPPKLYETLQYRLRDANGRMLVSFTTINGWTATVAAILTKAKTLVRRFAPLLKRDIPVEQNGDEKGRTKIFYFWTQDNIFLPMPVRNGDDMAGKPESDILSRQYGVPTKSKANRFPLFSRDVHVVKHEDIPCIKDKKKAVTWYTSNDPAGSKPWCMGWGAVDAAGVLWITHEWPDVPTYGEWVDPSGDEGGKPGPAQRSLGFGINDYVSVIQKVESEIGVGVDDVFRSIDPRMGASETQGENGAETIISRLDDKGYVYQPAPGKQVEDGEQLINDRLAYDIRRPVGVDNQPRIRISDRCENLIWALENYAGSGPHEPCKDPVDWLRYMLQSGAEFVDPKAKVVTGGGSY